MAQRIPTELQIDTTLLPLIRALAMHADTVEHLLRQVYNKEAEKLSEFELQLITSTVENCNVALRQVSTQISQRQRSQSVPHTPSNSNRAE